jgi:hypothetical protein
MSAGSTSLLPLFQDDSSRCKGPAAYQQLGSWHPLSLLINKETMKNGFIMQQDFLK